MGRGVSDGLVVVAALTSYGGGKSPLLFQMSEENMPCSLKLQNTFWGDGGTHFHFLVGGTSHGLSHSLNSNVKTDDRHILSYFHGLCFVVVPSTKLSHADVLPGVGGVILDSACLSIHLLVCQFFYPSFICLTQIIAITRGCVICDDFWPWPLSPRSLGLEQFATKRLKYDTFVHYTTPRALNGFSPYWLSSSL